VLVLRYWSELSEAEIGDTLGIARGTVKSTARAHARLQPAARHPGAGGARRRHLLVEGAAVELTPSTDAFTAVAAGGGRIVVSAGPTSTTRTDGSLLDTASLPGLHC
jgi:hypothetical protein